MLSKTWRHQIPSSKTQQLWDSGVFSPETPYSRQMVARSSPDWLPPGWSVQSRSQKRGRKIVVILWLISFFCLLGFDFANTLFWFLGCLVFNWLIPVSLWLGCQGRKLVPLSIWLCYLAHVSLFSIIQVLYDIGMLHSHAIDDFQWYASASVCEKCLFGWWKGVGCWCWVIQLVFS